jgi:hypothetical protein
MNLARRVKKCDPHEYKDEETAQLQPLNSVIVPQNEELFLAASR